MSILLVLALFAAVTIISWAAGRMCRLPTPACSQDCNQGRNCNCCRGVAALAPEEIAP